MSKACAVAGGIVAALVVATLAYGQARPKPASHAGPASKPKAAASADNPYDDKGSPVPPAPSSAASAQAAPGAPVDGGPASLPPPAPPAESSDAGAASPLNPPASEFSDAGIQPVSVDYDRLLGDIASLRA